MTSLNVKKTMRTIFSLSSKKKYLVALLLSFSPYGFSEDPSGQLPVNENLNAGSLTPKEKLRQRLLKKFQEQANNIRKSLLNRFKALNASNPTSEEVEQAKKALKEVQAQAKKIRKSLLKGNQAKVFETLDALEIGKQTGKELQEDIKRVLEGLDALNEDEFSAAYKEIAGSTPLYNAISFTEIRNQSFLANAIFSSVKGGNQIFVTPLGYLSKLGGKEGVLAQSKAKTYGISGAALFGQVEGFTAGAHLDWLRTNLKNKSNGGYATLSTINFGPIIRYGNDTAHLTLLGNISKGSYKASRDIKVNSKDKKEFLINESLESEYGGWNYLAGAKSSIKFWISEKAKLAIIPMLQFNYINLAALNFSEVSSKDTQKKMSFAGSFAKERATYLNPRAEVKLVKDFILGSSTLSPAIRIGWVSYIPLKNGDYNATFAHMEAAGMNLISYEETTHQLVIGGDLEIASSDNFSLTMGVEGNFGAKSPVTSGIAKMNWSW